MDQAPPLPKDELILLAEALSLDGLRGWLTPEGAFFEDLIFGRHRARNGLRK
jgi:hypothetical protein